MINPLTIIYVFAIWGIYLTSTLIFIIYALNKGCEDNVKNKNLVCLFSGLCAMITLLVITGII